MEKKKLTQEMIDSGKTLEELGFTMVDFLPYSECEACAMEQARQTSIIDPDGVVYPSYNFGLVQVFLQFKYMTDVDTDDWDTEEGRMILYDMNRRGKAPFLDHLIYRRGWHEVDFIYGYLYDSLKAKHERRSTLDYKIGKTFEGILGDRDIVKVLAESREVSEKLVDMLAIFRETKNAEEDAKVMPLTMFAKK